MKQYTVYFIIKKNNHGYMNEQTVNAKNQKEAIKVIKESVKRNAGKNAFRCSCKKPVKNSYGLEFNGIIYTKYTELFHMLW